MVRKQLRLVPLVAAVLIATGACTMAEPPDAQYAGVCVDQVTQQRIDDSRCGDYDDEGRGSDSGSYFVWINTGSTHYVPGHGQRVEGSIGARTVPKGTPIAKGVPAQGGSMSSIQRGGFGMKSATTSGIGSKGSSGS
jgi:hypothetical protein